MTGAIFIQSVLDGFLLSLSSVGLLGRGRGRWDRLLLLLFAGVCLLTRLGLGSHEMELAYVVLPVDHIVGFLFLFLGVLLLNSLWFRKGEGHTFFGTVAVFALYLLLRELCLLFLALCGVAEPVWYLYVGRVLSLCLWLVLWSAGALRWLRDKLAEGDHVVCMVCSNTALLLLLLLLLFQFDLSAMLRWLPLTAGAVGLLAIGDSIVILLRQHRLQLQRRTAMLEQYLPLVEELIEQVRARQHDFNNQMMAVAAAISTAADLQEAQEAVSSLLQIRLNGAEKELLKCDSKVIGGLLFGKIKQAELKGVRVEVTVAGAFLHRALSEADWVELIAVLLDNAIEAAQPGDVVYAKAMEEAEGLRFSVSNPHSALSNVAFIQMFRRGWSTKGESGHGYGLYNVLQLVERYGGKLITGNEQRNGRSYITIGVLIS